MSSREGKTEAPTQKKKKDTRKKGQSPKSADLAPWLTLLVATYVIPATVQGVGEVVVGSFDAIRTVSEEPDPQAGVKILGDTLQGGLVATLPILLVCILVGVVSTLGQTGMVVSLHPLKPDIKRINPMQGLKRLVSKRSLWETAKQVAKGALIAWLAWPHIQGISAELTEHGRVPLHQGITASVDELVGMIRAVAWGIVVIALVDVAYQRRQQLQDMKMTKQEVRDEYRNSEGDQQVKGRIRSMQAALARSRMMADVPTATVVLTNPTHVAVAVRYDMGAGGAPKVVAAGVGNVAARIREAALEAGVPIVESKPLARALWRSCDVGDEIPVALYEAVAKVLAFVRRLRGGILAASALPLPRTYDVDRSTLDAIPSRPGRRRLPAA